MTRICCSGINITKPPKYPRIRATSSTSRSKRHVERTKIRCEFRYQSNRQVNNAQVAYLHPHASPRCTLIQHKSGVKFTLRFLIGTICWLFQSTKPDLSLIRLCYWSIQFTSIHFLFSSLLLTTLIDYGILVLDSTVNR